MRAAAILGLGSTEKDLRPFQIEQSTLWSSGMPASAADADVILLFGGDGTIHRHLGDLVKLELPVLIVPAGSGNDFARALGLRRVGDSRAAWQAFLHNDRSVRKVDLGLITASGGSSRYFCSVAGVGIDGEVVARANRMPRWLRGHGGYVLSLAPAIFTFAPLPMKILTASENRWTTRSDQPTVLAAIANSPVYGGGMKIAPQAKMDDGLLDVCVVGAVGRVKLLCMFPSVYGGRHLKMREVEYFQAGRVRVETEHPVEIYADGEYVCRTPVEISIERGALQVIGPV